MAAGDSEIVEQLIEAGNLLQNPPEPVEELLCLLDKVELMLSKVEQSPSKPVQNALTASIQGLVADWLFRHSNQDVKVSIACCISEITRITAPDAPYDDNQMKEVFKLIIGSFQNLNDMSSRSYPKRVSILETAAKVRSCVVMLDLECEELIVNMFQHFLNTIREYHPEAVFTAMETIMVLVLEESEDLSAELLAPLLHSVKKSNKDALPVARNLAEKVLERCAAKVKPYLLPATKSLGFSIDDCSDAVASNFQEFSSISEQIDIPPAGNKIEAKNSEVASDEVAKEHILGSGSQRVAMSNGFKHTGKEGSQADASSPKKQVIEKADQVIKRRGRKKGHTKMVTPSLVSQIDKEDKTKEPFSDKGHNNAPDSASRSLSNEVHGLKNHEVSDTCDHPLNEDAEFVQKKRGRPRKDLSVKTPDKSPGEKTESRSEELTAADSKSLKHNGRIKGAESSTENIAESDQGGKKTGPTTEEVDVNGDSIDASSPKQYENRRRSGKNVSSKNETEGSVMDDEKDALLMKSTTKSSKKEEDQQALSPRSSKRKRSTGKALGDHDELNESLVGTKVEIWWPLDHAYYKGLIASFDPITKKHKVSYDDGDEEILDLRKEKWKKTSDQSERGMTSDQSPGDTSEKVSGKKQKSNLSETKKQLQSGASPGEQTYPGRPRGRKSGGKIKEDDKEEKRFDDDFKVGETDDAEEDNFGAKKRGRKTSKENRGEAAEDSTPNPSSKIKAKPSGDVETASHGAKSSSDLDHSEYDEGDLENSTAKSNSVKGVKGGAKRGRKRRAKV